MTSLEPEASSPPRIALTKREAATSIGVSIDFFEQHVQPDLAVIRRGRLVLVPTDELRRWATESAARTLPYDRATSNGPAPRERPGPEPKEDESIG